MKQMTIIAALAVLAVAALALAGPSNVPLQFGVIPFGASATALLDGGTQTSSWVAAPNNYILNVSCTAQDAGANAALGCIQLEGSNTASAATQVAMGSPQCFPGNGGTLAVDPIYTGFQFLAVQVDGGGTVAGSVQCTMNGRGGSISK
jgi:hypothetical protein